MKLPPLQISSKVKWSVVSAAATTVIVGIVSESPLSNNPWLRPLKNAGTVGAIVSLAAGVAGYSTEEKVVFGRTDRETERRM